MKWWIIIIILAILLFFYFTIRKQIEENKQKENFYNTLGGISQSTSTSLSEIDAQQNIISKFINSQFVTTTSGIFGQIWGSLYSG